MLFTLKTIIAFIVALLILVSVHEYGHYLVARFFNIKVLRFSIGFGKPFWSKKKGDTEWCLAPIPLGGYVKMGDTREGEVALDDLPYAFDKQHPLKRIAVVVAGPLTNLILAIVFFAVAAMFGVVEIEPMVGTVVPNSVAERAGIQENVRINKIDGKEIKNFTDVGVELLLALDKKQAVVINATDENGQAVEYKIDTQKEKAAIDAMARGKESIGIMPYRQLPVLSGVLKDGAAGRAGLQDGDKIIAIDSSLNVGRRTIRIVSANSAHPCGSRWRVKVLHFNRRYIVLGLSIDNRDCTRRQAQQILNVGCRNIGKREPFSRKP